MTLNIYNINNPVICNKMASFDYDWTLVNPKGGKIFPSSIDDWQWLYPNIPTIIKQYHDDGYMIVVFSNQSKPWKYEQIQMVMKELNIPLFIVIATDKKLYKPNIKLFDSFVNGSLINKEQSFYVGDALGRKTDFSDSDKVFAENIGIKCYSPEDIFVDETNTFDIPAIPLSTNPEIIIMVGFPGSGKSTIANNICKNNNYNHISGDIYKTTSKMRKASLEYILDNKSIVFDATYSSIKKRKELVDFAKKYNYEVKCIHVNTSLDISYKRNKLRADDKQVPKIAYSVYKKYYEEPIIEEGFSLYTV
jgi:bifunctional polynucleotide phosphatase/kinase